MTAHQEHEQNNSSGPHVHLLRVDAVIGQSLGCRERQSARMFGVHRHHLLTITGLSHIEVDNGDLVS